MTLSEAKKNIGGLVKMFVRPSECTCEPSALMPRPDGPEDPETRVCRTCKQPGIVVYAQIIDAGQTGFNVLMEDFRLGKDNTLCVDVRFVPGDGFAEFIELVEPPRVRSRV